MVMPGHLYHVRYANDGTQAPSSLSPQWIEGVLRSELGYDGVVISDDLKMSAIRDHFMLEQIVTQAVRAGLDVLLFSNMAKYYARLGQEVLDILLTAAAADLPLSPHGLNRLTPVSWRSRRGSIDRSPGPGFPTFSTAMVPSPAKRG